MITWANTDAPGIACYVSQLFSAWMPQESHALGTRYPYLGARPVWGITSYFVQSSGLSRVSLGPYPELGTRHVQHRPQRLAREAVEGLRGLAPVQGRWFEPCSLEPHPLLSISGPISTYIPVHIGMYSCAQPTVCAWKEITLKPVKWTPEYYNHEYKDQLHVIFA